MTLFIRRNCSSSTLTETFFASPDEGKTCISFLVMFVFSFSLIRPLLDVTNQEVILILSIQRHRQSSIRKHELPFGVLWYGSFLPSIQRLALTLSIAVTVFSPSCYPIGRNALLFVVSGTGTVLQVRYKDTTGTTQ